MNENNILKLFDALSFAADKHKYQRRKGDESKIPYINHPIQVAKIIADNYGTEDSVLLIAALLHDTIEDTGTKPEEIKERFGEEVLSLVLEVTDDKNLPYQERKDLQIMHAPGLSHKAKILKLADKTSNIMDIVFSPPAGWSLQRLRDYITWAEDVISGVKGINERLETKFEEAVKTAKEKYK